MPRPTPIPAHVREAIAADIRFGMGRNAIARAHGVSAGTVTNIARSERLYFPRSEHTAAATEARQLDLAEERLHKAEELWDTYLNAPHRRDGTETRRARKASYALYNLDRHHNGRYPST
jgi:hypothetical protein